MDCIRDPNSKTPLPPSLPSLILIQISFESLQGGDTNGPSAGEPVGSVLYEKPQQNTEFEIISLLPLKAIGFTKFREAVLLVKRTIEDGKLPLRDAVTHVCRQLAVPEEVIRAIKQPGSTPAAAPTQTSVTNSNFSANTTMKAILPSRYQPGLPNYRTNVKRFDHSQRRTPATNPPTYPQQTKVQQTITPNTGVAKGYVPPHLRLKKKWLDEQAKMDTGKAEVQKEAAREAGQPVKQETAKKIDKVKPGKIEGGNLLDRIARGEYVPPHLRHRLNNTK
ncbi:hypothetical protein ABW19_dt0201236 [Dactylella cylindrospora]|nr:hypothetical protein ABW19_dt0201236 [Dactylella cylindrospora]